MFKDVQSVTEQSTIPEEGWRALSIRNTRRIMVENQY